MKRLFGAFILVASVSAFAGNALEMTGFRVIKNTSSAKILTFQDKEEFIISKARFSSAGEARKFCKREKSKLDSELNSLLIAMSGAAEVDKFMNDSISFSFNKRTGIWQWTGVNDNIVIMIDGQGTRTHEVEVEELNRLTKVALPAICVRPLK
jgi:hypothetical protein